MNYVMTDWGPMRYVSRRDLDLSQSSIKKDISDLKEALNASTLDKISTLLETIKSIEEDGVSLGDLLTEIKNIESSFVEKQDVIDPNSINIDNF